MGAEAQPAAEKEAHTVIPGIVFSQAPSCGPWVSSDGKNLPFCTDLRWLP